MACGLWNSGPAGVIYGAAGNFPEAVMLRLLWISVLALVSLTVLASALPMNVMP
jgi:hypothetical protein